MKIPHAYLEVKQQRFLIKETRTMSPSVALLTVTGFVAAAVVARIVLVYVLGDCGGTR
jgi:hypothetical protein